MRIGRPNAPADPVRAAFVRGDEPDPRADRRGDAAAGARRPMLLAARPQRHRRKRARSRRRWSGTIGVMTSLPPLLISLKKRRNLWSQRSGAALCSTMGRSRAAGGGSPRRTAPRWCATWSGPGSPACEWAGYAPTDALKAALEQATPAAVQPLRIVRLASDRGEADAKLEGPALWRRSEPGSSTELAEALAADLLRWSRECVAF